mmetsp:Transcript_30416/g.76132  ORF Transcript_30416/g.76132 Transcript_30416/m.76132 type:complete len:214 (+) Transcript_30416:454-1095(+)
MRTMTPVLPSISSHVYRSWLAHSKLLGDGTFFAVRSVTTSRACTSSTTSAASVLRCSLVSCPRTFSTMSISWSAHRFWCAGMVPVLSASSVCDVQYRDPMHSTTCPGHSIIQSVRLAVAYAAEERTHTSATVSRCALSHSMSHFSTLPPADFGLKVVLKAIFSPSSESMAVTSRSGWNSSWLMASNTFLRNGCTRSGSLVSDRISRSSSLDRK